jgi:Tc toxin complex TcA C-terminal TcB-binding domain
VRTTSRALLYARRPARSLFINAFTRPTDPPGAFRMGIYVPDAAAPTPGSAVFLLGEMAVAHDTTSSWELKTSMGLALPLKGEHQYELQRIQVRDLPPGQYKPWLGLVFDSNRQVPTTKEPITNKVEVPAVDPATGSTRPLTLLLSPSAVAVTADPWGPAATPKADAFAVTASHWSLLCLSAQGRDRFAGGGAPKPSEFYAFPMYHPFASELRETVRSYGLTRAYDAEVQANPSVLGRPAATYASLCGLQAALATDAPTESIDFERPAPYALYNWELFLHAPLAVADQLRTDLKFEAAQRYLHFVFNPFSAEAPDPARPRARFWVTKPFRQRQRPEEDEDVRAILTAGATSPTSHPYEIVEHHPFDADAVAQGRTTAYQKFAVTRYLDNLIAWADSLYRASQPEDINESTQLYLLAEALLGPRPEALAPLGTRRELTFEDADWGGGGNVLVDLESFILDAGEGRDPAEDDLPLVHLPLVAATRAGEPLADGAADAGARALYFCVPPNPELLKYWDVVARRLDGIRQCKTIDGVTVKVPLLGARIDPRALAEAAAAGLSVADALTMAFAKPPPHRFRVMVAKAREACNDVKALGAALLAALEKRDGEALARARSTHEGRVLDAGRVVKEWQQQQTLRETEALEQQRATIAARRDYYASRPFMNELEQASFGLSLAAAGFDTAGLVFDVLGGVLYLIPNVNLGVSGFGGTPQAGVALSGQHLGASASQSSQGLSKLAGLFDRAAAMTGTQASYARREDDWKHQAAQAALELEQLEKQIVAARLRHEVIGAELAGHDAQQRAWQDADRRVREKFSNTELYDWLAGRLLELYRIAYEQAREFAALAEACFRFETGDAAPVIANDHWESARHGLTAGERLARDLNRLEMKHLAKRHYDHLVVQHVPLSHVDPLAMLHLKKEGGCSFVIPAWWFKRAYPGLTRRRVRSIAVSVPCIAGPYASVNASLRLNGPTAAAGAIYLSTGVNDYGCDLGAAAEQYLPFEGASLDADTSWTFGFPKNGDGVASTDVDFGTISDVILRVEYTADEGGDGQVGGPARALVFVDLRQMASEAWFALVEAGGPHECTFDAAALMPSFLANYSVAGFGGPLVALGRDGTDHAAAFDPPAVTDGRVTLRAKAGADVPWAELERILLTIDVSK